MGKPVSRYEKYCSTQYLPSHGSRIGFVYQIPAVGPTNVYPEQEDPNLDLYKKWYCQGRYLLPVRGPRPGLIVPKVKLMWLQYYQLVTKAQHNLHVCLCPHGYTQIMHAAHAHIFMHKEA